MLKPDIYFLFFWWKAHSFPSFKKKYFRSTIYFHGTVKCNTHITSKREDLSWKYVEYW